MSQRQEHTCMRCGYASPLKANLIVHLNKKTECEPRNNNISREELLDNLKKGPPKLTQVICEYCKKAICRKNYSRHRAKCTHHNQHINLSSSNETSSHADILEYDTQGQGVNNIDITSVSVEDNRKSNEEVHDVTMRMKYDNLSQDIKEIIDYFVSKVSKTSSSTINNTINNVYNVHNSIIINSFGNEDLSHRTPVQ
jgi:hypothetical protein